MTRIAVQYWEKIDTRKQLGTVIPTSWTNNKEWRQYHRYDPFTPFSTVYLTSKNDEVYLVYYLPKKESI